MFDVCVSARARAREESMESAAKIPIAHSPLNALRANISTNNVRYALYNTQRVCVCDARKRSPTIPSNIDRGRAGTPPAPTRPPSPLAHRLHVSYGTRALDILCIYA